jgi:glycine/D-amino acid oxidase-like deaminating enzyme
VDERPGAHPEVGWDIDPRVRAWPGLPVLPGDRSADACVVGLGPSGLAAVSEFATAGLDVVGLDAGRVGGRAAGRNGGFLLGGGAPALHEAQRRWGAAAAVELYRQTLAELDRLAGELGSEVVHRGGSIRLAGLPGPPGDAAEAADQQRELEDCTVQARAMRAAGLRVEPYAGELGTGLRFPDDAQVNPAVRVLAEADRLRRGPLAAHVALYEHSPVRRVRSGLIEAATGSVRCRVAVVAVDGRLDVLLPQLAGAVRTSRLQMAATAPVRPGRLPAPVYARWGYDYAQQDVAGRLYVGGGRDRFVEPEWTTDTAPTAPVQAWIDTVARRMAGQPVTVEHRWAAPVGYTRDGRPLCAAVAPGVLACGGYNGTGNLVGPIVARAAARYLLTGGALPPFVRTG